MNARPYFGWEKGLGAVLLIMALTVACSRPDPLPTLLPTVPPPVVSPTPPPTFTPTRVPTATFTASPTPRPSATPAATATATRSAVQPTVVSIAVNTLGPLPLLTRDLDWAAFAFVARAMSQTPRGQHYLALYQQHRDEWLALQRSDPAWAQRTYDLFKAWEPAAQALMRGQGDVARLTPGLIALTQAYLEDLAARASPELAATIQRESATIPWEGLGEVTINVAWAVILQSPPPPPVTPPPVASPTADRPPAATPMP